MLRMPEFRYHHPKSPEEAVALFHANPGAAYVAGGTDLLPNVKQGICSPTHLIGLSGLPKGRIELVDGWLRICGGVRLVELANSDVVGELFGGLSKAASLIAGPQIRNMGTVGGNILLDTRCHFYNQTELWRRALGYCLKREGEWCHVLGSPKSCVATQSSDLVPLVLALDGVIVMLGREGERRLSARELFRFDGMDHLNIEEGELLVRVELPVNGGSEAGGDLRTWYDKVRVRGSIDFPMVGVGIAGHFDGDTPNSLEIVVGAIGPKPKPLKGLDAFLGSPLDDEAINAIGALAYKQSRPQGSVPGDSKWRREMVRIEVERGLAEIR